MNAPVTLKRIDGRRTGSRVRHSSRAPGSGRRTVLSWAEANARMRAIERWERRQAKDRRRRNRAVGHIGVELYKFLVRRAVDGRGRLDDVSYEAMAGILGFAKSAIVAAAARLKAFGWLDWVRTFAPTGQPGIRGMLVEQGINAYWIEAPAASLAKAGIRLDPPKPDDDETRRTAEEAQRKTGRVADSPLGDALARAAAAARRRESS